MLSGRLGARVDHDGEGRRVDADVVDDPEPDGVCLTLTHTLPADTLVRHDEPVRRRDAVERSERRGVPVLHRQDREVVELAGREQVHDGVPLDPRDAQTALHRLTIGLRELRGLRGQAVDGDEHSSLSLPGNLPGASLCLHCTQIWPLCRLCNDTVT